MSLATSLQPDIIVMDIKMPIWDGLEATRRLRNAGVPSQVLILTGTNDGSEAQEAMLAGAAAFLLKEEGINELRNVFFEVASLTAALGRGVHARD